MTVARRSILITAAAMAGAPVLGGVVQPPGLSSPAHADGTDIDLGQWLRIPSLSDDFTAPIDPSRWRRGLWYPTSGVGAFRDENADVSGDNLRLHARRESYGGKAYTFGAVESVFDTPGVCSYVEVRAKALTTAANVLSAIWLQSSTLEGTDTLMTHPNPEIDVQETFKNHAMSMATHLWPAGGGHIAHGGREYASRLDVSQDYHMYGVERRDGRIRFYWDRHLAWDLPAPDPSLWRMSRHVVLSLEGHRGRPVDSRLPATFDIDYVHTYSLDTRIPSPERWIRVIDPGTGLCLTRTGEGVVLAEDRDDDSAIWILDRQDDLTCVLTGPDGGVLGLEHKDGGSGTSVRAVAGAATGPDTQGSRQRWHCLEAGGGFQLLSKLSGLPLVVDQGRPVLGRDSSSAPHPWRLEAA
ncbi:MAG: glycoside hydrolase family 16 protein [Actinomyces bowdenii]|nr:glycoside hydrolase family 16 protein [Actinomyces bowdenii]